MVAACASRAGRGARSASCTGGVRAREYDEAYRATCNVQRGMTLPPVDRAQLVATRRDLHQHPELGFEERRTGTLVAERLTALGYSVTTGVGRTGVVGVRDGAQGSCVLVRADMDALPVEEANDVPYRSKHAGK